MPHLIVSRQRESHLRPSREDLFVSAVRTFCVVVDSWSDLALACRIHVGLQRLMSDEHSGLGIGAETEEALRLQGAERIEH